MSAGIVSMRVLPAVCLLAVVPLGFALKYYHGPGHGWCNLYGAGVLYELFWCLLAFLIFPKKKNIPAVATTVFAVTSVLEILQLWHVPLLEYVRSNTVGVWLIGNGFDWLDFPHYAIGCWLGYLVLGMLSGNSGKNHAADVK